MYVVLKKVLLWLAKGLLPVLQGGSVVGKDGICITSCEDGGDLQCISSKIALSSWLGSCSLLFPSSTRFLPLWEKSRWNRRRVIKIEFGFGTCGWSITLSDFDKVS